MKFCVMAFEQLLDSWESEDEASCTFGALANVGCFDVTFPLAVIFYLYLVQSAGYSSSESTQLENFDSVRFGDSPTNRACCTESEPFDCFIGLSAGPSG